MVVFGKQRDPSELDAVFVTTNVENASITAVDTR